MNKAELTALVAQDAGITKTAAGAAIDSILQHITSSLSSGERVTLVGFGTFEVAQRKARTGHNPHTGARVRIGPRRVPRFNAGKGLKDAVS